MRARPLHELADDEWYELPDGGYILAGRYRAQIRVEAKKAKHIFEKARAERSRASYVEQALF